MLRAAILVALAVGCNGFGGVGSSSSHSGQPDTPNTGKGDAPDAAFSALAQLRDKKRSALSAVLPGLEVRFADSQAIDGQYSRYVTKTSPKDRTVDNVGKLDADGKTGGIGVDASGEHRVSTREDFEPTEVSDKVRQILEKRLEALQLSVELVAVDTTRPEQFQKTVETLKRDFSFDVDPSKAKEKVDALREEAAQSTLARIGQECAKGAAVIQQAFTIAQDGAGFRLKADHPVSDFIAAPERKVSIVVPLDEKGVVQRWKQTFTEFNKDNRAMPLYVYGECVVSQKPTPEVRIIPFAVF